MSKKTWGFISQGEHWPGMCETLGSIRGSRKGKGKRMKHRTGLIETNDISSYVYFYLTSVLLYRIPVPLWGIYVLWVCGSVVNSL